MKECRDNSSSRLNKCTVLGDSWAGDGVLNGAKFCTKRFKSGATTPVYWRAKLALQFCEVPQRKNFKKSSVKRGLFKTVGFHPVFSFLVAFLGLASHTTFLYF